MRKIFISSTSKDLIEYRYAAEQTCLQLGYFPIEIENFPAMGAGATEGSKRKVDEADLYIGIFAHRYGSIEPPNDLGVTEIEFEYAGERKLDRLCFVVDPQYPWPPEHIDHENFPKIEAFKKKIDNLIRAEFTDVNDFRAKLTQALTEWGRVNPRRPGWADALLIDDPDGIHERPHKLFGRDTLLAEILSLLKSGEQVLLHGFGGMGKTAMAAEVVAKWGQKHVLWLKTGSSPVDPLFEALARPFGLAQPIARESVDRKIKALYEILRQLGITMLVLDDCWNSAALHMLLQAVPPNFPVLMTARHSYPIECQLREVKELAPEDGLKLLEYHAGRDLSTDSQSKALCKLLGYHAFAIEIAGKNLKSNTFTPAELFTLIQEQPDILSLPLGFSEPGRENVAKLINVSLEALDDAPRTVFLAFGAFFAPRLTAEILIRFFIGKEEITDEMIADVRANVPDAKDQSDDELRKMYENAFAKRPVDVAPIEVHLTTLQQHGLIERISQTNHTIAHYAIHDLAYTYIHALAYEKEQRRALEACMAYAQRYDEATPEHFAALRPELENLMGAAIWAAGNNAERAVEGLASYLCAKGSKILDLQGYFSLSIQLLQLAVAAEERMGSHRSQCYFLSNLGRAYEKLTNYRKAINYYQHVLQIGQETGDNVIKGVALGNLGNACNNLSEYGKAIEYYQQALTISRPIGDKRGEGNQMGNLGDAYNNLGEYGKAIEYYQQALFSAGQIGDRQGESAHLGKLGNIYDSLGEYVKAIEYHQQAFAVARQIGDRQGESAHLVNLGNAYDSLGEYRKAIEHYDQAFIIAHQIGDRDREGQVIGNLGSVYNNLGEYGKAVEYCQQALSIAHQTGDRRGIEAQLSNLGRAYNGLGEYSKAIEYYQQALSIVRQIGDRRGEGQGLGSLGLVYTKLGDYRKAIDYYEQAKAIFVALGVPHLIEHTEHNLTAARAKQGSESLDTPPPD